MNPQMRFGEIRKFVERTRRRFDLQRRQTLVCSLTAFDAALLPQHNQTKPRPQLSLIVCLQRREQPRKVRSIEFDRGEVIWFEVSGSMFGFNANHLLDIDRGYYAWSIEPGCLVNRITVYDQLQRQR